jgi:hypothetical protein
MKAGMEMRGVQGIEEMDIKVADGRAQETIRRLDIKTVMRGRLGSDERTKKIQDHESEAQALEIDAIVIDVEVIMNAEGEVGVGVNAEMLFQFDFFRTATLGLQTLNVNAMMT